jgi:hypothetical protein
MDQERNFGQNLQATHLVNLGDLRIIFLNNVFVKRVNNTNNI